MKYQSELIKEIVDTRGHKESSLHYESECVETWIEEAKGGYPKLCDYESEWLNYITLDDTGGGEDPEPPIGEFPYVVLSDVTEATIDNVVPYAYKSAILKGKTDENLQSVKMPVLTTTNGNLLILSPNTLEMGSISGSTGGVVQGNTRCHTTNIKVSQKDDLFLKRINCNYQVAVRYYYGDTLVNKSLNNNGSFIVDGNLKVNGGEDYDSIKLIFAKSDNSILTIEEVANQQIMLVPNNNYTTFEPHKSNILTVNEDIKLCGIGDIRDELDCLTGKVTKRISESVLNGSEDWILHVDKTYTKVFKLTVDDIKDISHQIICDCLPTNADGDVEKITNTLNNVYLALSTSKANTLAEFKAYLSNNPMIVQYPLKTESDKTVDLNIQDQNGNIINKIKPIEGTMHLSTSSDTIKPLFSGEIPVEAITQNLASFIDLD